MMNRMVRTASFHAMDGDDEMLGEHLDAESRDRINADEQARKLMLAHVQMSRMISMTHKERQKMGAVTGPSPVVAQDESFQRVVITGSSDISKEQAKVARMVKAAVELRDKYVYKRPTTYDGAVASVQEPAMPMPSPPPDNAEGATELLLGEDEEPSDSDTDDNADSGNDEESGDAPDSKEEPTPKLYTRRPPSFTPFHGKIPGKSKHSYSVVDGVVMVYEKDAEGKASETPCVHVHAFEEFVRDYNDVVRLIHFAPFKTFAYNRMQLLGARFDLHKLLNSNKELMVQKNVPHRDFYNVWKVDTHVHHSACMNQKHMLRFIKRKLRHHGKEMVIFRDGQFLSLAEVFKSLHITTYDLSVDTLDMHADSNTFHRFDRFNLKYNPCGQSRLREVFLKTDNLIAGRYLAELSKQVFNHLESSKYQLAEYRVSIYGRKVTEWEKLSSWIWVNRLSSPNVRWLIQIPRLYQIYKKSGQISCFQDMLDHIFLPLFHVTVDPSSNPPLHYFLQQVVGFDCVDDESRRESARDAEVPPPAQWTFDHNPPYYYWMYYISANLQSLNQLRASRNMTTFSFRPHSGEAGDIDHLAAAFLTAESVNHGITMRKSPALQYLYYLTQTGLAMSPLSNNRLFVDYHRNPFQSYFACGLNVSLSTDDPLILHYTKEPLVEEYCVAAQVWKHSSTDMCEIARNSVLQSGFEHRYKKHYLGENYHLDGVAGNNIRYTNLPNIRVRYRKETFDTEIRLLNESAAAHMPKTKRPTVITPPPTPAGAAGAGVGSGAGTVPVSEEAALREFSAAKMATKPWPSSPKISSPLRTIMGPSSMGDDAPDGARQPSALKL